MMQPYIMTIDGPRGKMCVDMSAFLERADSMEEKESIAFSEEKQERYLAV